MIELSETVRADAIASIQRYFEEDLQEPIGDLPAGLLLNFFIEEIGPVIYNKGVEDATTRVQQRAADIPGELYVDQFQYWSRKKAKRAR